MDLWYGPRSRDPWSLSQSQFNVVEIVCQLVFLWLASKKSAASTIVGFAVSFATFYKTVSLSLSPGLQSDR